MRDSQKVIKRVRYVYIYNIIGTARPQVEARSYGSRSPQLVECSALWGVCFHVNYIFTLGLRNPAFIKIVKKDDVDDVKYLEICGAWTDGPVHES